jgi:hypothetical protein
MLAETIGYQDKIVGKRYFSFGKNHFLRHHLPFCRDEILSCALWSRNIEPTFNRLAEMLARGKRTENALLALLMVSMWHNHWINGSMMDEIRTRTRLPLRSAALRT